MAHNATQAVFGIVELLEQILILQPFTDLVMCSAVCQHWKQVIRISKSLQETLHLRPSKTEYMWLAEMSPFIGNIGLLRPRNRTRSRVIARVPVNSKALTSQRELVSKESFCYIRSP